LGNCVFLRDKNEDCQDAVAPCEGGETCNPMTGMCEANPDAELSTFCERGDPEGLCSIDHCDGLGSCVFLRDKNDDCQDAAPPCEAGETCNPANGLCEPEPDATLSTFCERGDVDGLCSIDHCDGFGNCVFKENKVCDPAVGECDAGDHCDPMTGDCVPFPVPPTGTACEADGDRCTVERCDGMGNCLFSEFLVCPPPEPCLDSFCDPIAGCVTAPLELSTFCERGDPDGLCSIDHCDGMGNCVFLRDKNEDCPDPVPPCEGGETCNPMTGMCEANPDAELSTFCERGDADGRCSIDHCDGMGDCVFLDDRECTLPSACDGGTTCNPMTGGCDPNPDPQESTFCEADGDLCTHDHCDGLGNCVFLRDKNDDCLPPAPPCEAGQMCNPMTGMCDDLPDAKLSTPCQADDSCCTIDHCDGGGDCVLLEEVDCLELADECNNAFCDEQLCACVVEPEDDGTPCGNDVPMGDCDGPDICVSGICDPNLKPGGTLCRAAANECDVEEVCTGDLADCPEDLCRPEDTPCTSDGNRCTFDVCDGECGCTHPRDPLCGACCYGETGDCVEDRFEQECFGDQATFHQGLTCSQVPEDCPQHTGACCNLNILPAGRCTDGVYPQDCDPFDFDPNTIWHKDRTCAELRDGKECFPTIPAVSEWGLLVLVLIVLIVGKVAFSHRARLA